MREIPIKNYIKLGLICLVVICLSVICSIWYKRNTAAELNVPVVRGILPEITYEPVVKGWCCNGRK